MLKSDELKAERKKLLDRNDELLKAVEQRELSADEEKEFNQNVEQVEQFNLKITNAERVEWQALQKGAEETRSLPARVPMIKTSRKTDPKYDEACLLKAHVLGRGDAHTMSLANGRGIDLRASGLELRHLMDREDRDLVTGTTTAGGYTVKEGFIPQLIEKLEFYSKFRQFATVMVTANGEDMPWPSVDNTAGRASDYAETGEVDDDGSEDPDFGQIVLKRFRRATKVLKVSVDLLANTSIPNFPGVLAQFLAEQRARTESDECGSDEDGNGEPEGFFHGISDGVDLETGRNFKWTHLVDLESSIDPDYLDQPGVGYVMHPKTYGYIRKFESDEKVPIYIQSLSAGGPGRTINGYPVHFVSSMKDVSNASDGDALVAFGKLNDYVIRDIPSQTELVSLREVYRREGMIGLMLEYWWDARWTRTDSVKTLIAGT